MHNVKIKVTNLSELQGLRMNGTLSSKSNLFVLKNSHFIIGV